MLIKKFTCGPAATNSYLIWDDDERKALIIDAPKGCYGQVLDELGKNKLKLLLIANTHGHWDHIADNKALKEKTKAMIAVHKNDEKMLWEPGNAPFDIPASRADTHLDEGDVIKLGSISLEVMETPGHSPGSVCLYEAKSNILFSGDTLFAGSCGRTDFPGGDHGKMIASLKRLLKLPPNTKVYSGHGEETTVGSEKWIEEL
ncbi:MAG: MBL fold metallo-hydrolase [Candidatus Aenigmarchaeota archaeon]|nr:MBL fold metallo-hydrolase [Candidatus Aenigmarchaeota archaeon]